MINIQQSVGKESTNRIKDVRIIQTALVQTDFLSPEDYNRECLFQTIEEAISMLKNDIADWDIERSADLKAILEGTFTLQEVQLTATIAAIEKLQKKFITHIDPDGKVAPNGRTIRQLAILAERMGGSLETTDTFDVTLEKDRITVSLQYNNHQTTKVLSVSTARAYITKTYNWNGIIKMLQFAYKDNGMKYLIPNQLTGTISDDTIIIPDQAIVCIIKTQLKHSINTIGLSVDNLSKILRQVDALPGNKFITNIIKAKSKTAFFDESANENQCRIEDDMNIDVPGLKADSEVLYQFFRDMVRVRNGLWSDVSGVVNVVGFRRKLHAKNEDSGYNDTLATCWLEADENGILKPSVEINIASTEPGSRVKSRQLVAQTMTLVPGYHHLRQPGGRTRNAVKIGRNEEGLVWEQGDTTMNFHQGSNNFKYPGENSRQRKTWLAAHGLGAQQQHGYPTDEFGQQALHELNLVLSEIYLILSKYGKDGKKPPYQNLTDLPETTIDKIRMEELLKALQDFPLKNIPRLIQKIKNNFKINTNRNRNRVSTLTKELPEFEADIIENATVGNYSEGCQIIYDTEVFYTFWTRLLQRAQKVGQQRWYYTLINATELTRSDLIA